MRSINGADLAMEASGAFRDSLGEPWFQTAIYEDRRFGEVPGADGWSLNFGPISSLTEGMRLLAAEVLESADHSDGVVGIARGRDDEGNDVFAAAWQGQWNCAFLRLPPGITRLDDVSSFLGDFEFSDAPTGLSANSRRWKAARLHARKMIPHAGMLTLTHGDYGRRSLPRWAGHKVPVGELWRIEAENGVESLLIASDLAVGLLSPFVGGPDVGLGPAAAPFVQDGRATSVAFAESLAQLSWS